MFHPVARIQRQARRMVGAGGLERPAYQIQEERLMTMRADPGVVRGPENWNYIYRFLGFALAIEGTIIGMVPLSFPLNIIVYGIVGYLTFWLFIDYGPFQNWLVGKKIEYESRPR
jgi:hypothetical protein